MALFTDNGILLFGLLEFSLLTDYIYNFYK